MVKNKSKLRKLIKLREAISNFTTEHPVETTQEFKDKFNEAIDKFIKQNGRG